MEHSHYARRAEPTKARVLIGSGVCNVICFVVHRIGPDHTKVYIQGYLNIASSCQVPAHQSYNIAHEKRFCKRTLYLRVYCTTLLRGVQMRSVYRLIESILTYYETRAPQ